MLNKTFGPKPIAKRCARKFGRHPRRELFFTNPLLELRRQGLRAFIRRERDDTSFTVTTMARELPLKEATCKTAGSFAPQFEKIKCTPSRCATPPLWFNRFMSLGGLGIILQLALATMIFVQSHFELPRHVVVSGSQTTPTTAYRAERKVGTVAMSNVGRDAVVSSAHASNDRPAELERSHATIDQNSLSATSATPSVTGTFKPMFGGPGPVVVVSSRPLSSRYIIDWRAKRSATPLNDLIGSSLAQRVGIIWAGMDTTYDHEGRRGTDYSVTIDRSLSPGSYYIGVYDEGAPSRDEYEMILATSSILTVVEQSSI
ncbi:hypothetical protein [Bradyrhizobium liaoningense]|uniref:hypothetical protein n=1 Tax=Bradyrhizobium liaoningense TaxID=43992 RepID=UPI001BA8C54B|nr:hypothetical protein [Bradyrhizobium liaoningense]MBR1071361.1 hypothetical protein [Bradyrhizobium liaoningense]